jgi:mannose-6-phosphate isomerase-like protein (cupin superfamily)
MMAGSTTQPERFTIRTPYLMEGRSNTTVARTDQLTVRVKVYAEGGENALHAHQREDHAFVVLEGEATFYDAEGRATVIGPHDGIMLPHGNSYRFESTGDRNLVLLRVGSGKPTEGNDRVDATGAALPGASPRNHARPAVPRPDGAHFGGSTDASDGR